MWMAILPFGLLHSLTSKGKPNWTGGTQLLKCDHSTFQPEQIRCDLTVRNTVVILNGFSSFVALFSGDSFASFDPLILNSQHSQHTSLHC